MKKFILNTAIFITPFFMLYVFNLLNYDQREAEGDLARMGYFYKNPSPKSMINGQYSLPQRYTLLSEIDLASETKFDVLTIGDSFSEQDSLSYQNFLANKEKSVLHVDRFISGSNPIQTLVTLINSGLFERVKVDYIVLQSTERDFNKRTRSIDLKEGLDLEDLSSKVRSHKKEYPNYDLQFFSDATLKMPLNNFQYLFSSKPIFSKTYKVKTSSQNLFSNTPDHLLFYRDDIQELGTKNDSLKTLNSIQVLEEINTLLAGKNIELIVLVSPDKYDLYYPYISDKSDFIEPTFFSIYEKSEKTYKNVDSYRVLSEKLATEKDVYFYDDTHWSPKGAKIVADEVDQLMKK